MDDVKTIYRDKIDADEIDLIELVEILYDGKWKIFATIALFVFSAFCFNILKIKPNFEFKTELQPITSVEAEYYRVSNVFGFFEITPTILVDLAIEQIKRETLFEDAIRKHGFLDRKNFATEEAYNDAVKSLASKIELYSPDHVDKNKSTGGNENSYWTIIFSHNDKIKYESLIGDIVSVTNEKVRTILRQRFDNMILVTQQTKKIEIENLDTALSNSFLDYEKKMSNRFLFLSEQATIARQLNVSGSAIETQNHVTPNGIVTTFETERPFYLRGYEAIEKEMELIKTRTQKEAFVSGLIELEQKKRQLEQDKTIERAQKLFALTPVASGDRFKSIFVSTKIKEYSFDKRRNVILALSVVFGLMTGVVYVLFKNALSKRKERFIIS